MTATASYAIDSGGTIVWTGEGFADAARAHGHPDLAEQAVGRSWTTSPASARARFSRPRLEHTVCEVCELLLTSRPAG